MSDSTFTNYINALRRECEHREKLYSVGIFDILSQIYTFDICVELLEIIFNDTKHRLSEWIFEENFGEVNNTSISDIYKELTDKEGDDLLQSEEC
jgi:hypothetical protein